MKGYSAFLIFILCYSLCPAQWQSSIVRLNSDSSLTYLRDSEGNRVPDFSHAGYKGGGIAIPEIPTVLTIAPIAGDNTAHIQAAIDSVGRLPIQENGYRGALQLDTGFYSIADRLIIPYSGIVLRGKGDGENPSENTILYLPGDDTRTGIRLGGGSATYWAPELANTRSNILSERVLVGEYSFKVENPGFYESGDNIIIYHPCTQGWLNAIDGGGTGEDDDWSVNQQPIVYNRRILSIEDSIVTVDVPVYNTLDRNLAQSYIYKHNRSSVFTHLGMEHIRVDIEFDSPTDEAHAQNCTEFYNVEDAWMRHCTFLHFYYAGVRTISSSRITVDSCRALDPVAEVTGARMYNFAVNKGSSQILFRDCYASNGRHHYVSNGTSWVSGIVFLRATSDAAHTASEGHRRWSTGMLYDSHQEINVRRRTRLLALFNRGSFGTGHGWAAAHSVAWNSSVAIGELIVQKPPTAQNYAIACRGIEISGDGPFDHPAGFIEGTGQLELAIPSLYEAQLYARLNGKAETVQDEPLTNIDKQFITSKLKVYPNPACSKVYIDGPKNSSEPLEIRISNLQGQLILNTNWIFGQPIEVQEFPRGVYMIQIEQRQKFWLGKLVKI